MAGVSVYTFNEFGSSGSRSRGGMSDERVADLLETATAAHQTRG